MTVADTIITQKHNRLWLQDGGALPSNPVLLSSVNNQHMALDGLATPVRGSVDRIRVHDPKRPGRYITVGTSESPADFDTATLMIYEKHGAVPKLLTRSECAFNLYVLSGKCRDLSDFLGGWTDYVTILSGCEVTNIDGGGRVAFDGDDAVQDSLDLTITGGTYHVGALAFGEGGSTVVDQEILDVTYGNTETCGDCGPANNGTKWRYAVSATGTNPAAVVYSTDDGATWTALPITGIGASEQPTAIRVIGNNLVVFAKLGGGASLSAHYVTPINTKTGVPGSTWTKVTTGYVSTFTLNDVYVISAQEIYIAASGGYIYKSTDITSGVTVAHAANATTNALNRIHGADTGDGVLVAAGASGTVLVSLNRGVTWATVTTAPVAASLTALHALDANRYWVGSSAGNVYYTLNGGETWTLKAFTGSAAGSIADIRFASDEVGYIAHTNATPVGRVITTYDGGQSWTASASRILNLPTNLRLNRLTIPEVSNRDVRVNNLLAGGLLTGTDGLILVGAASFL